MTLLLFTLAAVAAALGTQAASALLVAAAVFAATGSALTAAATWTAALAAGAMWLTGAPRRLALPIAGAAAVLAAGAAPNAAAVLALWVGGSLSALFAVDALRSEGARRWGFGFALADVPLVVALALGSVHGFEGWPSAGSGSVACALALCAAGKVASAGGPAPRDGAGVLLITRTQALVATLLAVQAAPHMILQVLIVAGAAAFAAVPHLARDVVVDTAQEMALVGVAAAAAALGWGPRGSVWGALAAGTLIHHLRLSTGRPSLASVASLLTRASVVGLPFLPVVLAELEGAARARPAAGAALVVAFVYGLAARTRTVPRARLRRPPRLPELAPLVLVAAAFAAALWAPLFSTPHPPAGADIDWLPAWAAVAIGLAAVGGAFFPGLLRGPSRAAPATLVKIPATPLRDLAVRRYALEGLSSALVAVAVAMWAVGALRGFL